MRSTKNLFDSALPLSLRSTALMKLSKIWFFGYAPKFIDYFRQMLYSSAYCCNWLVFWLIVGCRVVYFVKRMEFNYVEKNNTCVMPRQHPGGHDMVPDVTIPDTFPPSLTVNFNFFFSRFPFFFFPDVWPYISAGTLYPLYQWWQVLALLSTTLQHIFTDPQGGGKN